MKGIESSVIKQQNQVVVCLTAGGLKAASRNAGGG